LLLPNKFPNRANVLTAPDLLLGRARKLAALRLLQLGILLLLLQSDSLEHLQATVVCD
jgi:hypothetical protein